MNTLNSPPKLLVSQILADLQRNHPGATIDKNSKPAVFRNQYSNVYNFKACAEKELISVFIKIPHAKEGKQQIYRERLAIEYSILKDFSAESEEADRYGVAEPIGLYLDWPALATHQAGNEELGASISRAAKHFGTKSIRNEVEFNVASCGLWLKEFQEKTTSFEEKDHVADALEYFTPRLQQLVALSVIDERKAAQLTEAIDRIFHESEIRGFDTVGRHNDFAGHNIMSADRKIRIIDFSMYDTGLKLYDPINFLFNLEQKKFDVRNNQNYISHLQKTFLESYTSDITSSPLYDSVLARFALNRLLASQSQKRSALDTFSGIARIRKYCLLCFDRLLEKAK